MEILDLLKELYAVVAKFCVRTGNKEKHIHASLALTPQTAEVTTANT